MYIIHQDTPFTVHRSPSLRSGTCSKITCSSASSPRTLLYNPMTDCLLPVLFEAMQDFSKTSQKERERERESADSPLFLLTDLSHAMHRFSVYRNEWFRLSASLFARRSLSLCPSARITGHVKKGATVNQCSGGRDGHRFQLDLLSLRIKHSQLHRTCPEITVGSFL